MSEVKKIATRDSYGAALVELAKDHPDVVVLDADLAAATKTGVFKKAYPDRHYRRDPEGQGRVLYGEPGWLARQGPQR